MNSILTHLLSSDGHIGLAYKSKKSIILQTHYQTEWKKLHKKPYDFFKEEIQSNRESKTGMLWQEWGN